MRAEQPSHAAISTGALIALFLVASPGHAQRVGSSVDVGAVAVRYADTLNAAAATLTPRAAAEWDRGAAEVTGTYSQFTSGGWSAQSSLSGSLFTPTNRGFLGELAGFAGGSAHHDGTHTGQILANGRLHFIGPRGELFVGAGGGETWVGGGSRSVLLGEAGGSTRIGAVGALFTASPAIVEDSIRYVDSQLSLAWARDGLDVGALVGTRFGDQLTSLGGTARSWGNLMVVASMTPRLALVVSGGSYPIDPTQGFPGGRYAAVSIRVTTGRGRAPIASPPDQPQAALVPDETLPIATGFAAEKKRGGIVTLKVSAPLARLVEISGDFTNWTPVQLELASDGSWVTSVLIPRGKYQMNLRLDGGKWLVPPGLLPMADEFGGSVGLLVIE